ncbi:C45 family autoproteolytic acyltransferase/hydolase [Phytohabitans flavus]|uniref:Peptidase C45 n=1 Tax=Phytohabitans flavus TaxID=1076124 RepID=A0A6F8XNG2_9ACTN|nr:C45 family peptidase [Phytohabitans flavus]BCB75365.1 peptidase C45 [Phytohabitans flavus]
MILELAGDAGERGRQHGSRMRDQIRARIAGTVSGPSEAVAGPWLAAIDTVGALGAELRGIAAGAGVPLHDVVLLNAFEAVEVARQVELGGCTAVALPGPILAQNWDANPSLAATVGIHLHRGPDIPTTVLLASPGGLGWIGLNAHGVALVNNDLLTRAVRPGVPSQAVRRDALAQATAARALHAIVSRPAVGGRAYLLADAGGDVVTVEVAAEAGPAVTRHPGGTVHTNHALAPTIAAHEDSDLLTATYPSSHARLRRATDLATRPDATPHLVLTDHAGQPLSICRHPSAEEPTVTAASVVFDCARRHATITLGNPCTATPVEIDLA